MKRWGRGVCLGIAAAAALFVLPAGASAKPHGTVHPGAFEARFHLRGSHGYDLTVAAHGHRQVTLAATKGPATAAYTVVGHASKKGIEADFGSLGKVSVRFVGPPPGRRGPRVSNPRCKGRSPIGEQGTFRGTIRFEGEEGFTAVSAHRATGGFEQSFRRICKLPGSKFDIRFQRLARAAERQPLLTFLLAASHAAGVSTELAIIGLESAPGAKRNDSFSLVVAGRRERLGRVTIERSIFTEGDAGTLLVSEPRVSPLQATVTLAAPFLGSATLTEVPGSPPSWSGNLGVSFAGAAGVPLTGEGFKAGFCRSANEDVLERCLNGLAKSIRSSDLPASAQGSGSHSQALAEARLSWSR